MFKTYSYTFLALFILSSCGGGGGGGAPTPTPPDPVPSVSFSSSTDSAPLSSEITLTWSSTNASSCTASGAWQGAKATSGSQVITLESVGNNEFTISCTGSGGTTARTVNVEAFRQISGVSVDGYIRGADIFIDTNNNYVLDTDEYSTVSEADGSFILRYEDGTLISLNGFDLDTNNELSNFLLTHNLNGFSDFIVVSPITTISSFLTDQDILKPALGIDNSIDIFTFDPVANKSTSLISDYLYEKGNQLTFLAYSLQNITNGINSTSDTSEDYFESIAEEISTEFSSTQDIVNIESSSFIDKVLQNISTKKSLSVDADSLENITAALANTAPVIQVYSEDEITTAVFNFSLSTFQTDIIAISNGTASSELINSYKNDIYNYIANDQNIDVSKIKPNSKPVILSDLSALSIDENEFNVGIIEAEDEEGDQIYFSLSGTDASLLEITDAGLISFKASPDFEVPTDSDGDNNYEFNVSVTDDASASSSNYNISFSSDDNANIAVQNIDEDLIFFDFSSIDGSDSSPPQINVSMQIDSLTLATEAALLFEYPELDDPNSTSFGSGRQEWIYTGVNTNDGINWSISHDLPVYTLSGNYKVRKLLVSRDEGNLPSIEFDPDVINAKGFETFTTITNPNQDISVPVLQQISDFVISGNDGDNSTPITVDFTASVVEDNIKEVRVFIEFPGGSQKDWTGTWNDDGTVTFQIELNPLAASGDYLIARFIIEDQAGNRITYNNEDLVELGLNNKWNIDNSIGDNDAPKILSMSLVPVYDDGDFSRKNIRIAITTDSQVSPIERIYIRLTNEDGFTTLDEDFPTEQFVLEAAQYVHTFALPFEYPDGVYNVDFIWIKDEAQNKNEYFNVDIKNNNWDHQVVFQGKYQFSGKVIDGYISGAEVFIDQNFNFNRDVGELSTISQSNGDFYIGTNDDDLYQCLQERPIVAVVPVGAIDETSGEVTAPYAMILPSIADAGTSSIAITPFTSLLSEAIIKAKADSGVIGDISLESGCGEVGNSIASTVSSEIDQLTASIQSSFGVSMEQLVSDYMSGSANSIINEEKAQKIQTFLPYFLQILDGIDTELSSKYQIPINTSLTLRESAIDTILGNDDFDKLPLDFYTKYQTNANSSGWYSVENIRARGAKIGSDGIIYHFDCASGVDENCQTNDFSISKVGDASENYLNLTYFFNDNLPSDDNFSFFTEDNRRWTTQTDGDGNAYLSRDCVFMEELRLEPTEVNGYSSWARYNSSYTNYNLDVDSCDGLNTGTKNLLVAKTNSWNSSDSSVGDEDIEVIYSNPNIANARFLLNKIEDPYSNRENLDFNALIDEIKSLPSLPKDINKMREYVNTSIGDRVCISYYIRDPSSTTGQAQETHSFCVGEEPADDEYDKFELQSDDSNPIVASSAGQNARNDFYNALAASSTDFSTSDYIGSAPVEDVITSVPGKTIDGYISGAKVFVDVNFNLKHDEGEYVAFTGTNGNFDLNYDDADANCVEARPLVADVPVGAIDETLGEITQAFKMVMPSMDDAGNASITVSPYSSLITDAIILGKQNSGVTDELTVAEGCGTLGNNIANEVSSSLNTLKTSIQNTYGVSLDDLLTDFIADPSDDVNETTAANIAKLFPWIRLIDEDISRFLSSRYEKDITANLVLSETSLDEIFSDVAFEELPLEFSAIYETKPNDAGWYQQERIISSGGLITDSGVLKRADCSETDTELCTGSDVNLERVANTATNYERDSSFINQNISIDSVIDTGSIYVTARDARSWRDNSVNWTQPNNRARECQTDNQIRFRTNDGVEYSYGTYSQGYGKSDCNEVKHYYTPQLEIQEFDSSSNESIEFSYYIFDILRTGVISNTPYDFIKNRLTIDPASTINEIAKLPNDFSEVENIRRKFNVDDYVLIDYYKTSDCTYQFEFGTNPRNDYYRERGCETENEFYSQDARDAMYDLLSSQSAWNASAGDTAPTSKVLGRLSAPYIEVIDYVNSDGTEVKYDVYPTYEAGSKVLDLSLKGASVDLNNLKDFLSDGIGNTPLDAKIYFNPDDSITATVPITLSLFQVNEGTNPDATADAGEDYMQISFSLEVAPSSGGLKFTLPAGALITAVYYSGSVAITKEVTNGDEDSIVISDGAIDQPSNLNIKLLNLLSTISDEIDNIEDFFTDNGTYFYQVYLNTFSIIDFHRNTVDYIQGSFTTKDDTSDRAVFVRDMYIREGETKNLCFFRSAGGDLPAVDINISFQERERPGRGGDINDFILGADKVSFAEDDLEQCITVEAVSDYWFDWLHVVYLDLSTDNPADLSRNQVSILIQDPLGFNRISGTNLK